MGRDIARGTHKRWQRANTTKGVAERGGPPWRSHSAMSSPSCSPARQRGACPCSPPLTRQHRHTSTRSSRQISQGKHNHEHSPSYGFILSPRHKASSDFWIFPSLFTSQWLSRIWRNLSRSTPLMLGCRQKRKTVLREKTALDFPNPVKQQAVQRQGNPPKEEQPNGLTPRQLIRGGEANRERGKDALQKQKRYGTVSNCKEMQHDFCA